LVKESRPAATTTTSTSFATVLYTFRAFLHLSNLSSPATTAGLLPFKADEDEERGGPADKRQETRDGDTRLGVVNTGHH